MGAMQRRKGQSGEREFFALLSEHLGFVVRRNVDQARRGGADGIEVPGWAIEVKRHESGFRSEWWEQACEQATEERKPALAYRASRQNWRIRVFVTDLILIATDVRIMNTGYCVEIDMPLFAWLVRESLPVERAA